VTVGSTIRLHIPQSNDMNVWILQTGEPLHIDAGHPRPMRAMNLANALVKAGHIVLMNLIDAQYTRTPSYGSRKMVVFLNHCGYVVNWKRVQRLMREMEIQGMCPGPNTSLRCMKHAVYPYLLKNLLIERCNHVWSEAT